MTDATIKKNNARIMPALVQYVTDNEGYEEYAYKDSKGIWTIGVGFNLKRKGAREVIQALPADYDALLAKTAKLDKTQIEYLLKIDLEEAIADVRKVIPNFDELSPERQIVLVDLRFNVGGGTFREFKEMISAVKAGDFETGANEMVESKWYKEVSKRGPRQVEGMRNNNLPKATEDKIGAASGSGTSTVPKALMKDTPDGIPKSLAVLEGKPTLKDALKESLKEGAKESEKASFDSPGKGSPLKEALKDALKETLKEMGKELGKDSGDKYGKEGSDKHAKEGSEKYTKEGGEKHSKEGSEKYSKEGGDKYSKEGGEKYSKEGGDKYSKEGKDMSEKPPKESKEGKESSDKTSKESGKDGEKDMSDKTSKESGKDGEKDMSDKTSKEEIKDVGELAHKSSIKEAMIEKSEKDSGKETGKDQEKSPKEAMIEKQDKDAAKDGKDAEKSPKEAVVEKQNKDSAKDGKDQEKSPKEFVMEKAPDFPGGKPGGGGFPISPKLPGEGIGAPGGLHHSAWNKFSI